MRRLRPEEVTQPGQTSLLNSRPPFVPPPGLTGYRTLRRRLAWCLVLTSCPLCWALPLTFLERWLSFYNRLCQCGEVYVASGQRAFHHLPSLSVGATNSRGWQLATVPVKSALLSSSHIPKQGPLMAQRVWTPPHLSLQILNICSLPPGPWHCALHRCLPWF